MATSSANLDSPITRRQLESALELNQFELHYQPLVDVRDHTLHGIEALVRWNHPQLGLRPPSEFIPLAEETGFIVALGNWVLLQACIDFRSLNPAKRNLLLSVNVSTRQLDQPDFIRTLADVLAQTGIPGWQLQLEITESIFLRDQMRVGALLGAIRALGVKIAFDDFGTGYSSLNYLDRYPVDLLKVDQYFVQNMRRGNMNEEIVHMIVHIARAAGMDVSAEGVESPEQAATLQKLGCNIAQGYLYCHPVPLQAIHDLLQKETIEPAIARRKPVRPERGLTALLNHFATH
jgi:EAL domain-containing protein (putative c-di-GMP-specific phosphodiesterase class I)